MGKRRRELRAIRPLARFDFDVLGEQLPPTPVEVVFDGFALGLEPETGLALLLGRHPKIADEFAARHRSRTPLRSLRRFIQQYREVFYGNIVTVVICRGPRDRTIWGAGSSGDL